MSDVEARLVKIEREIELLKRANKSPEKKEDWVAKVTGTFKNDPDFREIVRLGKEQRDAELPPEAE